MSIGSLLAHAFSRYLVGFLFQVVFRVRFVGMQKLPRATGAIFALNHVSALDSAAVPALFWWWPVRMLAKSDLWKNKVAGWYFSLVGQIPIRGSGSTSDEGLATAADWVRAGGKVGGFPEGHRNRDGMVHRGHTGIARLAYATMAPVYPIFIDGIDKIKWYKPWTWRITFIIGDPIYPQRTEGDPTVEQLVSFMAVVMLAIAKLGNRDYVDSYTKKEEKTVKSLT